jgi:hypothetical protein
LLLESAVNPVIDLDLTRLSDHAAIAISNAQLYGEVNAPISQKRLRSLSPRAENR